MPALLLQQRLDGIALRAGEWSFSDCIAGVGFCDPL